MKVKVTKTKYPVLKADIENFKLFSKDALWAYHPCVIKKNGKYYMFYTGKKIDRGIAHYACLAISDNLESWKKKKPPIDPSKNKNEWDNGFIAHTFVFKDDSKFLMLYDGSKKGNWLEEIGLAESEDLLNWRKYERNPIFKVGKNWWDVRHVSRCCVFKEKGIYYLYYAGHDGQRERIGLAKGNSITNLRRFLKEPVLDVGKKGEWDEKSISDPKIIKYKDKYLMLYSGINAQGMEQSGFAISHDLIAWEKYENNPILQVSDNGWDKISASRADIKRINNKLYIFYSGKKKYFYNIGLAELEIVGLSL